MIEINLDNYNLGKVLGLGSYAVVIIKVFIKLKGENSDLKKFWDEVRN